MTDVQQPPNELSEGQRRALGERFYIGIRDGRGQLASQRREEGQPFVDADERMWALSAMKKLLAEYEKDCYSDPQLPKLSSTDRSLITQDVMDRAFEGGLLFRIWKDNPTATNLTVSGAGNCRIERADGSIFEGPQAAQSDAGLHNEVRAVASKSSVAGKDVQWNPTQPEMESILDDGTRMTAQAWTVPNTFVTLRRPTMKGSTLDSLLETGTMSPRCASFLSALLLAGFRFIIAGQMNSGKTVLLRSIVAALPNDSHIITVESQSELLLHEFPEIYGQWVTPMEARRPNAEGEGEILMSDLITYVQRMSPSYVLVGEVRGGAEAAAYLKSLQQGYPLAGTVHANSSTNAVEILAQYYEEGAGAAYETALRRAASHIDVTIFMKQLRSGRRVVDSVRLIDSFDNGILKSEELWASDPKGMEPSRQVEGVIPQTVLDRLTAVGFDPMLSDTATLGGGRR